jgi:UDP-2,4-diacetamido-2,4,6-trideoxy-beta-L-altropyranose hydrolase
MVEQELRSAKTVVVRADSSNIIGSGHIMRCLALADRLKKNGATVYFICRSLSGSIPKVIEEKGYRVFLNGYAEVEGTYNMVADAEQTIIILQKVPAPVDWLVVDHYDLDKGWENLIRPYVKQIMVIDDLANRLHDCDLLLDQNLYISMETRYDGLVPSYCKRLLGPKYALLRAEFMEARDKLKDRDGNVKQILVFFGGSDYTNETAKALKAIHLLNRPDIAIDVVLGAANCHKKVIQEICDFMPNTKLYFQVNNMAELMMAADLAIGAGGTTTWERCFLGLPSITIVVADNQVAVTAVVAALGATWNAGRSAEISVESMAKIIERALNRPEALKVMGKKALTLMEGSDFNL